jgi:putative ABC transport system permease protein
VKLFNQDAVRTNVTGAGDPEELTIQAVTADFFPVLDVAPMLGRTFSDAENTDPSVLVVHPSHALWRRRFGGDASASALRGRAH